MGLDFSARTTLAEGAWPVPVDQHNTAVVFLNLEFMRRLVSFTFYVFPFPSLTSHIPPTFLPSVRTNFVDRLVESSKSVFNILKSPARHGEQCLLNAFAKSHPSSFLRLPCGCNYQVSGPRIQELCPVSEPVYVINEWGQGSSNPFLKSMDFFASDPNDWRYIRTLLQQNWLNSMH
jgi:hypothetical protein